MLFIREKGFIVERAKMGNIDTSINVWNVHNRNDYAVISSLKKKDLKQILNVARHKYKKATIDLSSKDIEYILSESCISYVVIGKNTDIVQIIRENTNIENDVYDCICIILADAMTLLAVSDSVRAIYEQFHINECIFALAEEVVEGDPLSVVVLVKSSGNKLPISSNDAKGLHLIKAVGELAGV